MKQVKYSDILIEAEKHLLRGRRNSRSYKSPYICDAIQQGAHAIATTDAVYKGRVLRDKIQNAIGDHFSIYEWLVWDKKVPMKKVTDTELQKYRHRWLNHLIKTFKEAGQ